MNDADPGAKGRKRRQYAPREPRLPRPLDAAGLESLALGYAARFATTSTRLHRYLTRKLRERPWEGTTQPDPQALIDRLTALGYVNDEAWASMKTRDLGQRGYGARRINQALGAAGIKPDSARAHAATDPPLAAAIRFAKRRRLGPFTREPITDPAKRQKQLAAMLRAGHGLDTARLILAQPSAEAAEALEHEE